VNSQLNKLSGTQVELSITAGEEDLFVYKKQAIKKLSPQVKVAGFRKGAAPPALIERNIDPTLLQTEFLDFALSGLYSLAASSNHVRPVTRPEVNVKKFVPYTALEFTVKTHAIGKIKLPNYKTMKFSKPVVNVTNEDVKGVLESLQTRLAEKKGVDRAAKDGDEVTIDFKGFDSKGKPINGADGKDYPLVLGSNSFIPGFEEQVIGIKMKESKTFTLTFPKDYGVKNLAGKEVKFDVSLKKVEEIIKAKVDDAFAAKIGPFNSVSELKNDIKKQLGIEKQREIDREYHNKLVIKIVDKTHLAVPPPLIEDQANLSLEELRRNLNYRGQTYQEFLEAEGLSEETHRETILLPEAEKQVKTSLILNEIAEVESLQVTPEELEIRIQLLKGQYKDNSMQQELEKPENRRDIASRLLTEKVLSKLEQYSTSSAK